MKPIHQWTGTDVLELLQSVDRKTWIKIGTVTGVALLVIYLFLWPAWIKRGEVHQKIAQLEDQMIKHKTGMRQRPEWIKNKEEYRLFIAKAKEGIYAPGEASLLLGAISKLAVDSKVSIISSQPKEFESKLPAPFDQQYEVSAYYFAVEGGYHELANFISLIESNAKHLRVQVFDVRAKSETPKTHFAEISLTAVSLKQGKA